MLGFHSSIMWMVLLFCSSTVFAADFKCPEPSSQTTQEVNADIKGKAQTFLKIGDAEISGTAKATIVDLYSKYPNADRVAIINTMISTTCNFIKSSTQLNDDQKIDRWMSVYQSILLLMPKSELLEDATKWKLETLCMKDEDKDAECGSSLRLHRPAEWISADEGGSWSSPEDEGVVFAGSIDTFDETFKLDGFLAKDGMAGTITHYNNIELTYHYNVEFYKAPVIQFVQEPDQDRGDDNYIIIDEFFHDQKYDYILSCQIKQRLLEKYQGLCHHFLKEVSTTAGE